MAYRGVYTSSDIKNRSGRGFSSSGVYRKTEGREQDKEMEVIAEEELGTDPTEPTGGSSEGGTAPPEGYEESFEWLQGQTVGPVNPFADEMGAFLYGNDLGMP